MLLTMSNWGLGPCLCAGARARTLPCLLRCFFACIGLTVPCTQLCKLCIVQHRRGVRIMAAQGLLDAASLLHLLSKLDGPDVAKCACVCRDWR